MSRGTNFSLFRVLQGRGLGRDINAAVRVFLPALSGFQETKPFDQSGQIRDEGIVTGSLCLHEQNERFCTACYHGHSPDISRHGVIETEHKPGSVAGLRHCREGIDSATGCFCAPANILQKLPGNEAGRTSLAHENDPNLDENIAIFAGVRNEADDRPDIFHEIQRGVFDLGLVRQAVVSYLPGRIRQGKREKQSRMDESRTSEIGA